MKYIFFGTPEFATIILQKLIEAGMPPCAVVTNPDRPAGRKKTITPPFIKQWLLQSSYSIDMLQPEKIDGSFRQQLENYHSDFFIVAAYGAILPQWLVDMPPKKILGVHPSLLPHYRGATPIQNAILAEEKITGVSLFIIDEKVDHGPLIAIKEVPIASNDTYSTLMKKLAHAGGELIIQNISLYLDKKITPRPQDHDQATYTKKITTQDAYVDIINDKPHDVILKIRALNPEPGVWTTIDNKRVKLLDANIVDGKLVMKKIQKEGGKNQSL